LNPITATLFDYFQNTFPSIRKVISDMESAPQTSLFSRDKKSYQNELDDYLDEAVSLLLPETPIKIRRELRRMDSELESLREEKSNREAERILGRESQEEMSEIKAVVVSVIGDSASTLIFGKDINAKIDEFEKQRNILIYEFQDNMENEFGINLTTKQCESLLYQVNGEDLIGAISAAMVLTEIEAHIRKIMLSADEDFSKKVRMKYYGLALIVRLTIERLTEKHLVNYDEKYLPALSDLEDDNTRLQSDSTRLLDELKDRSQDKLKIEQNIRSLNSARRAIDYYRDMLMAKRNRVEQMLREASKDAKVARSTLQTLEHVMSVGGVASRALEEFNSLSRLRPPDLLPLDDEKLYNDFLDISRELAVKVAS